MLRNKKLYKVDEDVHRNRNSNEGFEETGDGVEAFTYECLTTEQAQKMLSEVTVQLQESLKLASEDEARILLQHFAWNPDDVIDRFTNSPAHTIEGAGIRRPVKAAAQGLKNVHECQTCLKSSPTLKLRSLECGHTSCVDCWVAYIQVEVSEGRSTTIACMSQGCSLLLPQSFVLQTIPQSDEKLKERYLQSCFNSWVQCHPRLRFCVGKDCPVVIKAEKNEAKRVVCTMCKTQFCFACGEDYHAPTDCQTMKMWKAREVEDAATADYLRNYTKECPKCGVSINKISGCDNITCTRCHYNFCWFCLGPSPGSHSHSNIDVEAKRQMTTALHRYLFYYTRWKDHGNSLRSAEAIRKDMFARIGQRVTANNGAPADWGYLSDAANILAKGRYTLRYTYPLAFYLEAGLRKKQFEYKQAQFEKAVEKLSFQLEGSETIKRLDDIVNQANIVKKCRSDMLKYSVSDSK